MNTQRYGWKPDKPDLNDHLLFALPAISLPVRVDLRDQCPPVYDQGQLGSCTANAIAAALEFDQRKQGLPEFLPSRLFIYFNERAMEDTIPKDAGAMIRDGIKSVTKVGACPEPMWPYIIDQFAAQPSPKCYSDAFLHHALSYQRIRVHHLSQMRACLAAGFPFVFGFLVYSSFESDEVASNGNVPMPAPDEEYLGGHAVLAVGYDDETMRLLVRNSWSASWGMEGYFTMPYSYLMEPKLTDDFWVIRSTS